MSNLMRGLEHPGCQAFFEALLDGRLKLGQTLTQDELCAVLDLTLSRIREVTTLLEFEGLIEVRKRKGLTIFYPDVAFVGGAFQFREILECEGLRRFAENVPPGWISQQTDAHAAVIEAIRDRPDPAFFAGSVKKLERGFHDSFIGVMANATLTAYFRRNSEKAFLLRLLNPDSVGPSNTILSLEEHGAVIQALRDDDAAAAISALRRHISNVLHRVLTH